MKYKEVIVLEGYSADDIQAKINHNISRGFELFNFGHRRVNRYYAAMGKKFQKEPMDTGPK